MPAELLLCETNTLMVANRVLREATMRLHRRRDSFTAIFEHGQWWVEHRSSGAQWSVCDAPWSCFKNGATYQGAFDFELVTQGDSE